MNPRQVVEAVPYALLVVAIAAGRVCIGTLLRTMECWAAVSRQRKKRSNELSEV